VRTRARRVLIVSNGFPPSGQWGTEFYTHQLATGLAAGGARVSVLCPVRGAERPRYHLARSRRYGIDLFELTNAGDPRKAFDDSYRDAEVERIFGALLDELRPDVVHFTHLLWGLSTRLPIVARRRGAPNVVTVTDFGLLCHRGQLLDWRMRACGGPAATTCARCVREPGPWDDPAWRATLKRWTVRAAAACGGLGRVVTPADIEARERCVAECIRAVDHWIMPTRALGERFLGLGLPAEAVSYLTYGLDEGTFRLPRPARNGSGARFVYMSQFMPHKGLACLLDAVRLLEGRLPESLEPWRVHLHGNGSLGRHRLYARELVERGLPRRARLLGPFEPLRAPEVLSRTDAVIVPSEWTENAPLTVLQARAAGVPVLAADVPGVREVLEPGVHGTLFPPGDARALADAMGAVILGRGPRPREPRPAVSWREHLDAVRGVHRLVASELRPRPAPVPAAHGSEATVALARGGS